MSNAAETSRRLLSYLLARIPFISVSTVERSRALELVKQLCTGHQLDVLAYSISVGTRDLRTGRVVHEDRSLASTLEYIGVQFQSRQNLTVVFSELSNLEDANDVSRRFADLADLAERTGGSIVVITADPVWPRLQRLGMSVALDVPDLDEIHTEIRDFLASYRQQIVIEWTDEDYVRAASILCGVTRTEALNVLATLVADGAVRRTDLAKLSRAKDAIFTDLAGLERVPVHSYAVGGLRGLRDWLAERRPLLTLDLRDRDLRPPRGVLLLGVPGCGKSLSAKAIAAEWELPLYRLDMASIMGMYVGQSENRLRNALATVDSVAPCVLWIDEIEKGLAGTGTDSSGTTTRLVGQFLFWLQESQARVFVVATANDVHALPAELLRNGRFDAQFFVDLPDATERAEIISLYLAKHMKVPVAVDLVEQLVAVSEGFSGADIASAVKDIGYEAVLRGSDDLPHSFHLKVFRQTVPLSESAPERVREIRELARRALPAAGHR
jgi:ATPase family protein associated with various cellular activities (AAA)